MANSQYFVSNLAIQNPYFNGVAIIIQHSLLDNVVEYGVEDVRRHTGQHTDDCVEHAVVNGDHGSPGPGLRLLDCLELARNQRVSSPNLLLFKEVLHNGNIKSK